MILYQNLVLEISSARTEEVLFIIMLTLTCFFVCSASLVNWILFCVAQGNAFVYLIDVDSMVL